MEGLLKNDWFAKDYEKMRDTWLRTYGYAQLREDAVQADIDLTNFPEIKPAMYRCKKCNTPMLLRKGKFGEFLACPKGYPNDPHPTQKKPADYQPASVTAYKFEPYQQHETLLQRIDREMSLLGGGIHMTGVERMMVDGDIDVVLDRVNNGNGDEYDEAHWACQ